MMRSKACHKNKSANVKAKLMAKTSPTHVLQDQDQLDAIAKRMKRAQGQMGAVVRMLEEGRIHTYLSQLKRMY